MKNERILAYQLAQKLNEDELQEVAGGRWECRNVMTRPGVGDYECGWVFDGNEW